MKMATAPIKYSMSIKSAVAALTFALLFGTACQTARPQRDSGTATLSRELTDARRKMEEMNHRLSVLQFMVDSHERAISDLEREPSVPRRSPAMATTKPTQTAPRIVEESTTASRPQKKAAPVKRTNKRAENLASQTYTQAFAAMKSKDYSKALMLFREVAEKWPQDNLADNAIYWSGEIHYTTKDYSAAIAAFRTLLNKYPKGSKAPDALLKTGYSFIALKDKESARKYLKRVVMEHPFTASGAKAEKVLNSLDES